MTAPAVEPVCVDDFETDAVSCCEFDDHEGGPRCTRPAEWALRDRCCGTMCLGCDSCVKTCDLFDPIYVCVRCGTEDRWSRLFTRTRL